MCLVIIANKLLTNKKNKLHWFLFAFSEYSVFITVSMSGWRNPRGYAGVGQAVTYLLFTLRCQAGVLEVDCHSQLKTRPVSSAGEAAAGAGVFIWVSCYKSALSRHMSRGVTRCSSATLTVYTDSTAVFKVWSGSGDLTASSGHWGQDCFRRRPLLPLWSVESLDLVQGNILVVCSTWRGPTPSSQLGPAQCFLLCSFIGVLLSSPPLIPGLDVSQLFPTMHSSISAANRQAAANINKLRIKVRILSLSSNLRA